jgi:hypothetical protein
VLFRSPDRETDSTIEEYLSIPDATLGAGARRK